MVIMVELGRRMEEHIENVNKDLEKLRKNPPEVKNIIAEMKNTLGGINSRFK